MQTTSHKSSHTWHKSCAHHSSPLLPMLAKSLLIILCTSLLMGSSCANNTVEEASRRKVNEILAGGREVDDGMATNIPTENASPNSNEAASSSSQDNPNKEQRGDSTNSPPLIKEKRVYIDGSKSMAGFAGHGGDFDKLFGEIGYLLDDPSIYKYGSTNQNALQSYSDLIERTQLGQEQKSPSYYNLSNNPDDILFAALNQKGRDALSVYISDGVYSAPDSKVGSKVLTPLREWLESGRVLGIFIFHSSFKGNFYSQKMCDDSNGKQCWLKETVNVNNRPFYAFVFSPVEDELYNLQKKLKDKFTGMSSFILSDGGVTSNGLRLTEYDSVYGAESREFYWQMFTADLFGNGDLATIEVGLSYEVNGNYPVTSLRPKALATYYLWDKTKSDFVANEAPTSFKIVLNEDKSIQPSPTNLGDTSPQSSAAPRTLSFELQVPRDTRGQYGFYHIKTRVEVDELASEITQLSTNDDSKAGDVRKTYRFSSLMRALLDIHLQSRIAKRLAPPLFLTITN